MKPVEGSSTIHSVGYDATTYRMRVQFKDKAGVISALWEYTGVEPETHATMMAAPSVGSFLQTVIKREPARWPASRVEELAPPAPRLTNKGSRQPIDLDDPGQQITLLHDQWQDFKAETLPLALNEAQVEVLQQAFYAGARGVLNTLEDAFAAGLPAEECGKVMPAIGVEIQRYLDSRAARHN